MKFFTKCTIVVVALVATGCASHSRVLEVVPGTPQVLVKTTKTTVDGDKTTTTTVEYLATSSGSKHDETMAVIDKDRAIGVAKQTRPQVVSPCGFLGLGCPAPVYGGYYGAPAVVSGYGGYYNTVTGYGYNGSRDYNLQQPRPVAAPALPPPPPPARVCGYSGCK